MPYTVLLLEDAVKDIEAVYRHYRRSGSAKIAKDILSSLRKACSSLSSHPERGHIPPELSKGAPRISLGCPGSPYSLLMLGRQLLPEVKNQGHSAPFPK
jgi:plasmid stabilization system protein ParE